MSVDPVFVKLKLETPSVASVSVVSVRSPEVLSVLLQSDPVHSSHPTQGAHTPEASPEHRLHSCPHSQIEMGRSCNYTTFWYAEFLDYVVNNKFVYISFSCLFFKALYSLMTI